MADFQDKNNVAQAARVTGERDIVSIPSLWKWTVKGKVFEAGAGLEDTAIAMYASINDQYPTFALQAPASTTLLVIPLLLKVAVTVDGSALTELSVAFTKPAGLCATVLTISGTAFTSKHALYRSGGAAQTEQQAKATYTNTLSALVAADFVEYERRIAEDALLTTSKPAMDGPSNVFKANFLAEGAPHIMTSGAAMLVYAKNSTTDALAKCYMQWAELSIDDLA